MNMKKQSIPTVNYHLWEPCNMRCKFCFATFQEVKKTILPKGHLPKEDSLKLVNLLSEHFDKITFVGGEPTLCPWLPDLIIRAKQLGMNTGIVSNGTRLNEKYLTELRPYLDWVGLSIDSLNEDTNVKMGRAIAGTKPLNETYYLNLVNLITSLGFKLKINTVVNKYNYNENLSGFIEVSGTNRWKVFQVLPIKGENDKHIDELKITKEEFNFFLANHEKTKHVLVPENNEEMRGSYAMVDPAGRFFENSTGSIINSDPVLKVGVEKAYDMAHPDSDKFIKRGGVYNW
jgi:radical S-adenosyl methionine domain-containing protein 2